MKGIKYGIVTARRSSGFGKVRRFEKVHLIAKPTPALRTNDLRAFLFLANPNPPLGKETAAFMEPVVHPDGRTHKVLQGLRGEGLLLDVIRWPVQEGRRRTGLAPFIH